MHFAKKHKKGLKKTQANDAQAMDACAEATKALRKSKEVKVKNSVVVNYKFSKLTYIAHPKLGKQAWALIANVLRLGQPKAKAKPQSKTNTPAKASSQAPKGA
ncbi:large ribosomal subunit protein eL29-like [Tenrec ecaudatus]|uniref:large ribosomal subunit protein eL29-like n=1 Tax=Tenrec ecaudatus TaxID=94439 RepID=UPI003F5A77F6